MLSVPSCLAWVGPTCFSPSACPGVSPGSLGDSVVQMSATGFLTSGPLHQSASFQGGADSNCSFDDNSTFLCLCGTFGAMTVFDPHSSGNVWAQQGSAPVAQIRHHDQRGQAAAQGFQRWADPGPLAFHLGGSSHTQGLPSQDLPVL